MAFMMRFYNNAAKIFGILVVLCRRFVNVAIERHLKQAEGIDYQRLPLGYFLLFFFFVPKIVPKIVGKIAWLRPAHARIL